MKSLKTLVTKFTAMLMLVGLIAGCASVTDATFEEPAAPATVEQPVPAPDQGFGNGSDMDPIYDKPL